MTRQTDCPMHGRQGIGLACTHVAHAIDRGEKVGFSLCAACRDEAKAVCGGFVS